MANSGPNWYISKFAQNEAKLKMVKNGQAGLNCQTLQKRFLKLNKKEIKRAKTYYKAPKI